MTNLTNQSLIHQSEMARLQARGGRALHQSRSHQNAAVQRFNPASLSYQPTPELARETVSGYVERLREKNPAASQAVAEQFGRYDYRSIFRSLTAPSRLQDNNAADVLTAYTLLGWIIATGASDSDRAAVVAARDQIGARLAADRLFSSLQSRAKVAEEIKLTFVTLHAGWQSARREGNLQQYSDGVAAMFAKQGTDLRALRLTDQGLMGR